MGKGLILGGINMSDNVSQNDKETPEFVVKYKEQIAENKIDYANHFHFICDMDYQSVSFAFTQLRFDPTSSPRKILSEISVADFVLPLPIAKEFSRTLQQLLEDLEKKPIEGNDRIDGKGEK